MPRLDEAECRGRAAAARVGRLGMVRPDGTPWVSPICFAVDGDTVVSVVDAKPKSTTALARLAIARWNPAVELVVDEYDDHDWSRLWWVRLDGRCEVVDGADWAVDLLVAKYPQYAADRPAGPVLVIRVERWSGWTAAEGYQRA